MFALCVHFRDVPGPYPWHTSPLTPLHIWSITPVYLASLGHMSTSMLKHYTHTTSGAERRAVELLDANPTLVPAKQASEKVYRA